MILEEQRSIHEDLERLEQGISDRVIEDPKHVSSHPLSPQSSLPMLMSTQIRDRLNRDHQVASFLTRISDQSKRLLSIYQDGTESTTQEIQQISLGDPFEEFYKQLAELKDFHRKYPNEPVENLERAYKRRGFGESEAIASEVDGMFTGEEALGRFLDLISCHEGYLNLKGVKPLTYLQYLDLFDNFGPPHFKLNRSQKLTDPCLHYYTSLIDYLEDFMRRTRPLEDLDKSFAEFEAEFEQAWGANEMPGWSNEAKIHLDKQTNGNSDVSLHCRYCEKEFTNDNVYKSHLNGKKHLKAVALQVHGQKVVGSEEGDLSVKITPSFDFKGLREKAVAAREFRIRKLAQSLQKERTETRTNVERKQGMTERERQQEIQALLAESAEINTGAHEEDSGSDSEEKIYNPLKLPLAWDGKPIPYWLYKLHGLGVEFSCEVCGNFVYMGRRAFDKHFNEPRHIYGLKCLGITNTTLFREITGIDEALKLWEKIARDKKKQRVATDNVVQMEDGEGNVMPEKVYYDLQKQGLL